MIWMTVPTIYPTTFYRLRIKLELAREDRFAADQSDSFRILGRTRVLGSDPTAIEI